MVEVDSVVYNENVKNQATRKGSDVVQHGPMKECVFKSSSPSSVRVVFEVYKGGHFIEHEMEYVGGSIEVVDVDVDECSNGKMTAIIGQVGCEPTSIVYGRIPQATSSDSVIALVTENSVTQLLESYDLMEEAVQLYVIDMVRPLTQMTPSSKILEVREGASWRAAQTLKRQQMRKKLASTTEFMTSSEIDILRMSKYDFSKEVIVGKKIQEVQNIEPDEIGGSGGFSIIAGLEVEQGDRDVLTDEEAYLLGDRESGTEDDEHVVRGDSELEEEWLDELCTYSEDQVEEVAPEEYYAAQHFRKDKEGDCSYNRKGKEKVGDGFDTREMVETCERVETRKRVDTRDLVSTRDRVDIRRACKENEKKYEYSYADQLMWEEDSKMEEIELGLHSSFTNGDVFRYVIKNYALEQGFDFSYHKNDSTNIAIMCTQSGCNFWCWCSNVGAGTIMEITAWRREHSCGRPTYFKKFTSDFLAKRYLQLIRDTPTITPKILQCLMHPKLKYEVPMHQVYRTLNKAKAIIAGDVGKQYEDLFYYCEMIKRENIGSVANLHVCETDHNRFQRLYIGYAAQCEGFLRGCRPLVGIDGCHLKGRYGGQLLAAVGWDANDQMFPLAFAVVEQENKASWKWFLEQFFHQYGDNQKRGWVFLSDKQKGLVQLFSSDWLRNVEHRFCMRHMEQNWVLKFRGADFKARLWACAKATSARKFDEEMEKLKLMSVDAYNWLSERSPEGWCKAFYSDRASNSVQVNSMSECFNNWIKDGRDLPIYDLCEFLRIKIMEMLSDRSTQYQDYGGRLCEKIQVKLEERKAQAHECKVSVSGGDIFEVKKNGRTNVVNLRHKCCDCLEWQLNGFPCLHGVAVIKKLRGAPEDYVEDYYTMDTYRAIYGRFIKPVGSKDTWPTDMDFSIVAPPIVQKPPGRPRVRRQKSKGEALLLPYDRSLKRRCTKCNGVGHNKTSCTAKDHGETAVQRKRRTSKPKAMKAKHDKEKGKKAGFCTTESEFSDLMNYRRSKDEERRVGKRQLESSCTQECTSEQILAKKQEAERRAAKRQQRPTYIGEGSSIFTVTAERSPTIGLAQATLNIMRAEHVGHFRTLEGGNRIGGEAMFTRGTRVQRGRFAPRGGAAARRGTAAIGGTTGINASTSSQPPPTSTPTSSSSMNPSFTSQPLP